MNNDTLQKDQLTLARQSQFEKKCRECKWSAADPDGLYCAHTESLSTTGGFGQGLDKARDQEQGVCGLEGKLWEQADKETMEWRNGAR